MNQRFLVLGLLFSILVLAVNSTTLLNNALQNRPKKMNGNQSITKMKKIILNEKSIDDDSNINGANELNLLNTSEMNNIMPVANMLIKDKELKTFFKKSRFPRQVQKMSKSNKNINEVISGRHIKKRLNLKSKEQGDTYDYYDNGTYYDDYKKKTTNGPIEDWEKSEIELQEMKKCVANCAQKLGSRNLQQQLLSENIDEGIKSIFRCKNCKNLNPNMNLLKSKNSYNNNSHLISINDDYFINILKQLIDKLNTPKNLKPSYDQDIPLQRSNERASIKNQFINENIKKNSSEEEWILRLEKIKVDQIIDKIDSSPENTFVNGMWVKNKLLSKSNDCKPIVNDQKSDFSDKNESFSKNDTLIYNLNNPENKFTETNDNNSRNLDNFQIASTQENNEVSTSTLPGENKFTLASEQTDKPEYLSSTSKDFTDKLNEDNISSINEGINNNKDNQFGLTINHFSSNEGVSNEELIPDLNNTFKINYSEGSLEPNGHGNDNQLITNFLEGVTVVSDPSSDEKDNNINCGKNKKVVKNILNSLMIKNITEIKTDTYNIIPNNLKTKSNKRSEKLQKKNVEFRKSENTTNEPRIISIKNKNNHDSTILKNQIPSYKSQSIEPKVYTLQGSRSNKTNRNIKNILKNSLHNNKNSELKLRNDSKINFKAKINNIGENGNKRKIVIPNYLRQQNPRQFVVKSIENENDNYIKNKLIKSNINKITTNKNNFTTSKSSSQVLNKLINPISSRSVLEISKEHEKFSDKITKQTPRKVIVKLKQDALVNSKPYITKNFGNYNNSEDITTKKLPSTNKRLPKLPIQIINKPLSKTVSRRLQKMKEYNDESTIEYPKKVDKKLKINLPLDTLSQTSAIIENKNNRNNPLSLRNSNNFDSVKLRKSLSSTKSTNDSKIHTISKNNTHGKIKSVYPTRTFKNGNNINKHIVINKLGLKPIQSSNMTPLNTISLENDKIITTLKSKKSLNDEKKNPYSNILLKSDLLEVSKEDIYDYEHAPYKVEDLKPIIFDEPTEKSKETSKNKPNMIIGLKPLQSVPIIRPEYDDYYDTRGNTKDEKKIEKQYNSEFKISNYDSINDDIVNFTNYDVGNLEEKSTSQSGFEIIPEVKVVDGMFKVPLVGHTSFDNNGSKYISELFIPIEKSDNQHTAISLKDLLTGDYHLANGYDEHSLNMETPTLREIDSTFVNCTPKDSTSSDITRDNLFDVKTFKIFQTSKEDEKQTTPIHVIQIINNGLCSDNSNSNIRLKSKHNDEANFNKLRNSGRKLSSIRLRNIPSNGKQKNNLLGNAYNHFDSDILDRFLQVYSPVQAV